MFAATKKTEGRSPKTVLWYKEKLAAFERFLTDGEPAKLKEFTLEVTRDFIAELQDKTSRFSDHPNRPEAEGGLSTHTIHGYVRTLKVFSTWLYEEGFTRVNVLAKLKRPKVSEPVIEILSDEEINRLFSVINPNCVLGARQYVICLILLDTGIRASELCGLRMEDIHLEESYIKVLGKGNKERIVPISNTTKKALIRFTNAWRTEPATQEITNLILSEDGLPLTIGALLQLIKRLGKKAGIPRLHPHLLRHSCAVKSLLNGIDLQSLRLILGHTSIGVTEKYLHLTAAHVQVQHRRYSPVDQLNLRIGQRNRPLK
jgi:site-specific recombinase XerD